MFASVKLHDAIVNILTYPSLIWQTLLTADTVCLPGNHEIPVRPVRLSATQC